MTDPLQTQRALIRGISAKIENQGYVFLEAGVEIEFLTALDHRDTWVVKSGKHSGSQVVIWRNQLDRWAGHEPN